MISPSNCQLDRFKTLKIADFPVIWQLRDAPDLSPFFFQGVIASEPTVFHDPGRKAGERSLLATRRGQARLNPVSAILPFADDDEIDAALCVSRTKLFDRTRRESDPSRYVDTVDVPYVTLPLGRLGPKTGVKLGDLVVAIHARAGKFCFAVVGDRRDGIVAEPSLYLADALEMTDHEEIVYLIFPDTGDGQGTIPTVEQIQSRGERLYRRGVERSWSTILADCFAGVLDGRTSPVDRTLSPMKSRRMLSLA